MGWSASVEATPGKVAEALAEIEPPGRQVERDQLDAAKNAAEHLVAQVSKRERVLVSFTGHSDPDGEGFDARHISVTVSRVDPEAIRQREEQAKLLAEQQAELERQEAEQAAAAEAVPVSAVESEEPAE